MIKKIFSFVGRVIFNFILLPLYKFYSSIKKEFIKIEEKNKLLYLISSRKATAIFIIFISIFTLFENKDQEIYNLTIYSSFLDKDKEEIEERLVFFENNGSKKSRDYVVLPTETSFEEDIIQIIQKTAIVQPIIGAEEKSIRRREKIEEYTVKEGDVLSTIAENFGVNLETILWENKLTKNSVIRVGQKLRILPIIGLTHKVKKGETLEAIAKKYKADVNEIVDSNKLVFKDNIAVDQILIVPNGKMPSPPRIYTYVKEIFIPLVIPKFKMLWPVTSRRITQYFWSRHKAIDIGIPNNTPIYAAEKGKVIFVGWKGGYGYTVILDHGNNKQTLYAHANQLLVKQGQVMEKGEVIAKSGSTGRSTGPHIDFRVIINNKFVNPLNYLR